jgi:hypothetical protein
MLCVGAVVSMRLFVACSQGGGERPGQNINTTTRISKHLLN